MRLTYYGISGKLSVLIMIVQNDITLSNISPLCLGSLFVSGGGGREMVTDS